MKDAYQEKIDASKAPKKWNDVKRILNWLKLGIRNGYDTKTICEKLNAMKVRTLTNGTWNYAQLQMQLLFMSRLDDTSSLARGWGYMMRIGDVTLDDMHLLQARTRA